MRSDAPPLAPTFRSRTQGDLLALLLLHPHVEWTISDIARRLDVPLTTVQSEVHRLVSNGILTSRKVGRARLVQPNLDHPAVPPLTQLTLVTFGPQFVVAEEFANLGAQLVLVFGSWAARYHGEQGATPGDIDVLVVGDHVSRKAMYAAAEQTERRICIPVNPVLRKTAAWFEPNGDSLLLDIKAGPIVEVVGRLG